LQELQERSLADERWVALFLDGKTFAADELVIALGITLQGEKRVLGLVQTATENQRVCAALLRALVERGFAELGASFKTTNPLESIMAQVEHRTAKVDHWRTSEQKQRWCAAALLLIEPRLRKVKGCRHLPRLADALARTSRTQVDAA
jgi:transposase-like protein